MLVRQKRKVSVEKKKNVRRNHSRYSSRLLRMLDREYKGLIYRVWLHGSVSKLWQRERIEMNLQHCLARIVKHTACQAGTAF